MNKIEAVKLLENLKIDISKLRKEVKTATGKRTRKESIKKLIISISTEWTDKIRKIVEPFVKMETIRKYDDAFNRLIELAYTEAPSTMTLLEIADELIRSFNASLIVPIQQQSSKVDTRNDTDEWKDLFPEVSGVEKTYFDEAHACAIAGWYRAATVLAWCAAADRMQRVVEREGFDKFNEDAKILHNKKGFYLRFSKGTDITDLSDYGYVSDSNTLLMLVYWGLLTKNQYARLDPQRTIRNHAAHPVDIPITKDDLRAFLRILKEFVFDNDKLKL